MYVKLVYPSIFLPVDKILSYLIPFKSNLFGETFQWYYIYHHWKKLIRDGFFLFFLLKPLIGVKGLRKRMVSLWCHIYTSDCLLYLIGNGQAGSRSPLTTFQDAVRHCQTASYLEQHMSHIKPTIKHRGMAAVTNKLFGPPSMNSSLHMERNLIFALALCMFKNDEPMHNHVLQTIYKKLTGTKLDCPRYGNHWELIGFQGAQFTCIFYAWQKWP